MRTSEVGVFRAAFDAGVNYVDTARVYMGGKNEQIVGEALKGYRDKVYVAHESGRRHTGRDAEVYQHEPRCIGAWTMWMSFSCMALRAKME